MVKGVQSDEISLWSNFRVNLLSHIGVIARLGLFWLFLMLLLSKIFFSGTTVPIRTKLGLNISYDIFA